MNPTIRFNNIYGCRAWAMFFFVMIIGVFPQPATAASADDAPDTTNPNYPRAGLCIYIGAGRDSLFTALAGNTTLLIHGLAVDDTALDAAQQQIAAANLFGRVTVEKLPLNPLPYVRDLANLVIVDDWAALSAKGIALEEVNRVLAPGGTLMLRKNGQWSRTITARPPEMDERTHPMHDADGNIVSTDKVIHFPFGFRFLSGEPALADVTRALVSANGRTFTVENLCRTTGESSYYPVPAMQVIARDAYNGLPLWSAQEGVQSLAGNQSYELTLPVISEGDRVFFYSHGNLLAVEAATGHPMASYPVADKPKDLLLQDGVLVSTSWKTGCVEAFDVASCQRKWSLAIRAQYMVAADDVVYLLVPGEPGQPPDQPPPNLMVASVMHTKRSLVAVDLQSGRERWHRPDTDFTTNADLQIQEAGHEALVVACNQHKAEMLFVLNAATGATRWSLKPDVRPPPNNIYIWSPIVGGNQIWNGNKKYDLKTGKVVGSLPQIPPGVMAGCGNVNLAGNILNYGRVAAYFDMAADGAATGFCTTFHAARGGCVIPAIPANGMYYNVPRTGCWCEQGWVKAALEAFGPCGVVPDAAVFAAERPIERGPAYGAVRATADAASAYPMFRANAERSAAVAVKLANNYKVAWRIPAVSVPKGPLAPVWAERLLPILSSPTVANNLVFVAAREANQVKAFDATTGKPVWTFTACSRVDSPPTITEGLAIFGAHDGYLYALRASDGVLAWRTRLAPLERRMVAWGQVESVWPAIGSVLVHEGIVYATAGRETESDGGIALAAFTPATGKQLWATVIPNGIRYQNDILRFEADALVFHDFRLNPVNGAIMPAPRTGSSWGIPVDPILLPASDDTTARFASGTEGLLDSCWMRLGHLGYMLPVGRHRFGPLCGELWAWNSANAFGTVASSFGHAFFGITRAQLNLLQTNLSSVGQASWSWKGDRRVTSDAYTWRLYSPPNGQPPPPYSVTTTPWRWLPEVPWRKAAIIPGQITSMQLTDSGLLIAGRMLSTNSPASEATGFCCLVSTETGRKIAELPMPATPTYEALALAQNCIFVSCDDGQLVCLEPDAK